MHLPLAQNSLPYVLCHQPDEVQKCARFTKGEVGEPGDVLPASVVFGGGTLWTCVLLTLSGVTPSQR